jgi:hypothetical protein
VGIIGFVIARIYQALGIHKILEVLANPLLYLSERNMKLRGYTGPAHPLVHRGLPAILSRMISRVYSRVILASGITKLPFEHLELGLQELLNG